MTLKRFFVYQSIVHIYKRVHGKWVTCIRAFDVGYDFPASQGTCYSGFGTAEHQILFSDVKQVQGGSGVTEHIMVIVFLAVKECNEWPVRYRSGHCQQTVTL